jgi:hypothetical protein
MVNENHFRFDRKSFFNFWKTIYSYKNCKSFFEIKLFVFTQCLIFDCWTPTMVCRQNPGGLGIGQHPATRILPALESGHRFRMPVDQIPAKIGQNPAMVRSRLDLARFGGVRPNMVAGI